MGQALATYDSTYLPTNGDIEHGREHSEAHTLHITHTLKRSLPPWYAMPLHGHNFTLKIRRNPKEISMQHQHSCSTLKSRMKIFGCMVQELEITFYPLDHYPSLHPAYVHFKG